MIRELAIGVLFGQVFASGGDAHAGRHPAATRRVHRSPARRIGVHATRATRRFSGWRIESELKPVDGVLVGPPHLFATFKRSLKHERVPYRYAQAVLLTETKRVALVPAYAEDDLPPAVLADARARDAAAQRLYRGLGYQVVPLRARDLMGGGGGSVHCTIREIPSVR